MILRILAKISTTFQVSKSFCLPCRLSTPDAPADGGWIKSHPLPPSKGRFGVFNLLVQQNQQIIQRILESNFSVPSVEPSNDDQILHKLRGLYSSCMDENTLDVLGESPLLHFVRTIRKLYGEDSADVANDDGERKKNGLTAAVAFLHSRGMSIYTRTKNFLTSLSFRH